MINGNYKNGLAITLQKRLINNLFQLSPFSTLKALNKTYEAFETVYRQVIPTLIFSTDKDYKVSIEDLGDLATSTTAVITQVQLAKYNELIKQKRKNVIDALALTEEQLAKFITLIDEVINEAKIK